MFEFRYVELMNWAYWPTIKLPLDQRTLMITGPNGSGKTTFLDALRTLLRAPRLSSSRRFTDYLIGNVDTAAIKAVVSNTRNHSDFRPFEFKGFTGDVATLAVLLRRRSGRWEKRFAVLDGDVPFADLKDLSTTDAMTPTHYSYELNQAGFSDALIKVLALEQGQTDQLCNRSPRELLDLLLDIHGDKEIINRYKKARENYHEASLELTQLGARLAEEQSRVYRAQQAAETYQRYRRLIEERRQLETVLIPQAEYKAAGLQIDEQQLAIEDCNLSLNPLDRELLEVETQLQNAETELSRRKQAVESARELKVELERNERDLDLELSRRLEERREIEALLALGEKTTKEPIEPLKEKLDAARRATVRLELQREDAETRIAARHDDIQGMAEQRKIYPQYVAEFTQALRSANIEHRLLCDLIDVTEPDWQLAIESILGRDRFSVLVGGTDQLKARQLGERFKYRAYIVEWDRQALNKQRPTFENSALQFVHFLEPGVPEWIVEALDRTQLVESVADGLANDDGVTVTSRGYRQDARGGVSIAVDRFYCGSLGQSTQRQAANDEIAALEQQVARLAKDIAAAQRLEQDLTERLEVQSKLAQIDAAKVRATGLNDEISDLNKRHHDALNLKRHAELKLHQTLDELNNFERDCQEQQRWLDNKRAEQSEFLSEIKELQLSIQQLKDQRAEIASRLDAKLLTPKVLAEVVEVDELTPRYYAIQNLLDEFVTEPEVGAVEVYEHHRTQYEQQRRVYSDHEVGLKSWEHEFRLARQKYMVVVEHTIREYRRNVLHLAELAGASAEVVMPRLDDEEFALENAELQVRFGYDGKRAADIGGVGHSGGQRVVSSLILLMSLATSGGGTGGFFIIDEPFAHLSIERIDDVSRFLDRTQCQFILTSPTTHNVNVFSAARLQLNFRIKKQNETFAPIPTIIRR